MKKLLSVYCCVLCFRSFQTVPSELANSSLKRSGEKVLVKALTALVNREENKNFAPGELICPHLDLPRFNIYRVTVFCLTFSSSFAAIVNC